MGFSAKGGRNLLRGRASVAGCVLFSKNIDEQGGIIRGGIRVGIQETEVDRAHTVFISGARFREELFRRPAGNTESRDQRPAAHLTRIPAEFVCEAVAGQLRVRTGESG